MLELLSLVRFGCAFYFVHRPSSAEFCEVEQIWPVSLRSSRFPFYFVTPKLNDLRASSLLIHLSMNLSSCPLSFLPPHSIQSHASRKSCAPTISICLANGSSPQRCDGIVDYSILRRYSKQVQVFKSHDRLVPQIPYPVIYGESAIHSTFSLSKYHVHNAKTSPILTVIIILGSSDRIMNSNSRGMPITWTRIKAK